MKKLMTIVTLLVTAFALVSPSAFAVTVNSPAIPISASVDGSLTLSVTLFKDSATGPTGSALSSINFGQLQVFVNTSTSGQTLRSSDTGTGAVMGGVVALVSANSHGLPYVITQNGTSLTGTGGTIPTGACRVVPVYSSTDQLGGVPQGTIPVGASVGPKASWVGTRTIYTSETGTAALRIAQAHYSITDDPGAYPVVTTPTAVLTTQAGGSYSGSVTFTVTA